VVVSSAPVKFRNNLILATLPTLGLLRSIVSEFQLIALINKIQIQARNPPVNPGRTCLNPGQTISGDIGAGTGSVFYGNCPFISNF